MSPSRALLLSLSLASFLLASCSDAVQAPTPLANANFNGNWQFTTNQPSSSAVTGLIGTLANAPGNQDSTSLSATGSLTAQGSCVSDQPMPISITGTITNPHDIYLQLTLSGTGSDGGTLTINGSQEADPLDSNTITGTYSINGGSCQTAATAFTAQRISQ